MMENGNNARQEPPPSGQPLARPGPASPPPIISLAGEHQKLKDLCSRLETATTANEGMRRPKGFKTKLFVHQREALKWMVAKEKEEPSGGILADDMGLGKTASMIALIMKSIMKSKSKEKKKKKTATATDGSSSSDDEDDGDQSSSGLLKGGTLIICPLTLTGHWMREIAKHTKKTLRIHKHHGPTRIVDVRMLVDFYDVVITTYGVVRQEANKGVLFKISWERVILDEAHEVRNPDSLGCKAVSSLEADHRWCVTGTPLHNSLLDMHALFKFLNWKPFSDRETWDMWFGKDDMKNLPLWQLLKKASINRRTKKDDPRGLPERVEVHVELVLDPNERAIYQEVADYSEKLIDNSSTWEANRHNRKYMYCLLLLRQVCDHLSLLRETQDQDSLINEDLDLDEPVVVYDSREDQEADGRQEKMNKLQILNDWNGTKRGLQKFLVGESQFRRDLFAPTRPSTKVEKLLQILRDIQALNEKAVVVSQWTGMLKVISYFLKQSNIPNSTISGEIESNERTTVVENFNDPSNPLKVLLLSLKAGGVGLNLIGGNHLILFDQHWNPQLDAQACDRIYRIGQKKETVTIYKLFVKETIEETISVKQREKLSLAETILDEPSQRNFRKLATFGENPSAMDAILQEARRGRKRKTID